MRKTDPQSIYDNSCHYWLRQADDHYYLGLSDWGQYVIGQISEVLEPPRSGASIQETDVFLSLNTDKANTDLDMPIAATIFAFNEDLFHNPGLINTDCYKSGWLLKIGDIDKGQLRTFLSAAQYTAEINAMFRKG